MASSVLEFQSEDGHDDGKHEPFDFIAENVNPTPTDLSLPNESFLRAAISLKDQVTHTCSIFHFFFLLCAVCVYMCVKFWGRTGGGGYLERSSKGRRLYRTGGRPDGLHGSAWHGFHLLEVLRGQRSRERLAIMRGDR